MILESGAGDVPSELATQANNLYGITYTTAQSAEPEVRGVKSWNTTEYANGYYQTTAAFTDFHSMEFCIIFRSRYFLSFARYATNPLIVQAKQQKNSDKMAEGLKDAGWATSPTYVDSLKSLMDTYNLRRFDAMTLEEFQRLISVGNERQQAVVACATSGNMYGMAAGWCQGWVAAVYEAAGAGWDSKPSATDAKWAWAVSTDSTSIPVGATVYSDGNYRSGVMMDGGYDAGHVGIYIGNGTVVHNTNGVSPTYTSLDGWIAYFGFGGWGWNGGTALNN
jgi:hypothetical protein